MRNSFQVRYLSKNKVSKFLVFALSIIILVINIYPVLSQKTDFLSDISINEKSVYRKTVVFHTVNGSTKIPHELYLSIPVLLYNHYVSQRHDLYNISEYSNYITPNMFKSIAENIQKVINTDSHEDEIFANAVLEIIQRIEYNSSNIKFPIETLVENSGDCDPLSILTASILKAGGLDVVLFFYSISPISHDNVGVQLAEEPIYQIGTNPFYHEYEGKKYYAVETVGDYWNVGDQPESLHEFQPQIISFEDHRDTSPLQISSNLDNPLLPSSISLNLSPNYLEEKMEEPALNVSGFISTKYQNQPVFVNIIHDSYESFNIFKTVTTDETGNYSFICNFNSPGLYIIQASWNGLQKYAGSVSEKFTFYISLSQELDDFEINNIVNIGPEIVPTKELNSSGNLILEYQSSRKILEKNFIKTNVLLSAEFIMLRNNESISSEQEFTIPSYEYTIYSQRGNVTRTIPDKTVIIPNYKQRMNNHLEFKITQNDEKEYSSSATILSDYDYSQIIDNPNLLFFKNSQFSKVNSWYKITAEIMEDKIFLKLFDDDTTYFSETISLDQNTQEDYRFLLKYEPDSIIVIKDVQIERLDQSNQDDELEVNLIDFSKIFSENNLTNQSIGLQETDKLEESISIEFPIFEISFSILLITIIFVFIIFYKKFRK
ncbi:MAG: hypothetical protein P8Y18_06015 [Candidatus Bathyarchaeota archaeon]